MNTPHSHKGLELLSPAKNKAFGMAAVDHGADAVYIGAQNFSARAAVGNSIQDIHELCRYAHFFRAKVYVALNAILFDHELEEARNLIFQLWDAGADALIIQDMGLLELDLPPIPLFASTQTDNRTKEKVTFLEQNGFQRVILARELGLNEIADIRAETRVDLEAFVHGALCVCYSGQCYMSAAIGGRSANRGACGQPCRLQWNLTDSKGKKRAENRYLLSLKDMDRSAYLADLSDAGITSFKIEGRLKNLAYLKNITAFYREKLDALLEERTHFQKASSGKVSLFFTPDPEKTFNRGTTDYFLTPGKKRNIHSMDTPKSKGKPVGQVKQTGPDWFTLTARNQFSNGDGFCFQNRQGQFKGFRINKAEPDGKLFLSDRNRIKSIGLEKGMPVFRNHDQAFEKQMESKTAERRAALTLIFKETDTGIALTGIDEDQTEAKIEIPVEKQPAKNPQQALATIVKQLGKLGASRFYLSDLTVSSAPIFIQAKILNQLRRDLIKAIEEKRDATYTRTERTPVPQPAPYFEEHLDFKANVANKAAEIFYKKRGVKTITPAFEIRPPDQDTQVMTTRHCILHALGRCAKKDQTQQPDEEGSFYLENDKGRFRVFFDCKRCRMSICKDT